MVALISWMLFTQKRLVGVFITTLPFKNILWSNHIYDQICEKVPFSHTKFDPFIEL